jgi:hypothetical protein
VIQDLMHLPCVLLKRTQDGPPDEYGNPSWQEVEQPTMCEIQQSGSREELGAAVQISTWRVFLPPDAPARGWDALRLTADGTVYELSGDAWPVRNLLSNQVSHVEGTVTKVE